MTVDKQSQSLSPSAIVILYQLDMSPLGVATTFYFTKNGREGAPLYFDGQEYTALDIVATGFGYDGGGSFPTPRLQVANMAGTLTGIVQTYGDLVGATLTRIRTYETFLDDGATPDPTQTLRPDIFTIEQKTAHNKIFIEWRLSSIVEETDRQLPGRLCLRDYCPFVYRTWNGVSHDLHTCPYTGSNYFDENDVATTQANDKCGKTLNSCTKRFGARNEIKFGGFPGVGRDRTY